VRRAGRADRGRARDRQRPGPHGQGPVAAGGGGNGGRPAHALLRLGRLRHLRRGGPPAAALRRLRAGARALAAAYVAAATG
jgi:hypothetical protein